MDYGDICREGPDIILRDVRNFNLDDILDCGQCFRWEKIPDATYKGNNAVAFKGIAFSRQLVISQEKDSVVFHETTSEDFENLWKDYFDLGRDYGKIKKLLSKDKTLANAMEFAPGIRVARQEPWEALCTFILSQNNNIPRIKGLVSRLCEYFGDPVGGGFDFPSPRRLAGLTEEDLAPVRAGFRAKYIIDAAKKVAGGEIKLDELYRMPLGAARERLMTIHGVGPKVADCALLYGLGRVDCVPVDVWIKRAMGILYPRGFPKAFEPVAGIAQQYLFHYVRKCEGALEDVAMV